MDHRRARLRQWLRRSAAEERMQEEIRFHLETETDRNERAGMGPEEAWRRAGLACYVSARRAARGDPVIAARAEYGRAAALSRRAAPRAAATG